MDMYCLYQLKDTPENTDFLYQPYDYVISHGGLIHESRYNKVYEGILLTEMSVTSVRDTIKKKPRRAFSGRAPGTGDVIALDRMGLTECYYLDPYGMVPLSGFFREIPQNGLPLTPQTTGYVLNGKTGLWQVADTVTVENSVFFLLESMEYGRQASCIITDAEGHIVTDDNKNDFDEEALAQIRCFLHPTLKTIDVSRHLQGKPPQEQYQKYYENGTYERSGSPEVTEEQNYNMIDGRKNNTKAERESVRKRLKEKLSKVHGEPMLSGERIRRT